LIRKPDAHNGGPYVGIAPDAESGRRSRRFPLSRETIYYRFMSHLRTIPRKQIQDFVFINHRNDMAIVGTVPAPQGEEIIAIGRYYLNDKTNFAEVAFIVRDDWQNKGIGTFMLKQLINVARRNGIQGFTAEVLRTNVAMQSVFQKSEFQVTSTPGEDVVSFSMHFG